MDALYEPIDALKRTSPVTLRRLRTLGIETFNDLLHYFPSRYDDYSLITTPSQAQAGETVTIKGTVAKLSQIIPKGRIRIQKAVITSDSGEIIEATWYNQPYLLTTLKKDMYVSLSGSVKQFGNAKTIEVKEYEILQERDSDTVHTGRLVPTYPEKNGVSSRLLREKIKQAVAIIPPEYETLPYDIVSRYSLVHEGKALSEIHFPASVTEEKKAHYRLSFDELFVLQLSSALVKKLWLEEKVTHPFSTEEETLKKLDKFIQTLPFTLTHAQQRVVNEICSDLKKTTPMNRFLQGDVGSGKTVVAAIGAYYAHLSDFQTLIMAPTEILAQQHFKTISSIFQGTDVKIALQTGSVKDLKKKESQFDVIVGTHALLSDKVLYADVGLIVVDEQHRFGVKQRAVLREKGAHPHLLTMTATPIPRTVALTLYGELDLSVIDELPKGRLPIKTHVVPSFKRQNAYSWIAEQIDTYGIQAFIVCPLIEESEIDTMKSVKAATKEYENLSQVFAPKKVGLLHGKMSSKEKEQVMNDFKDKKYHVLVTTSVVEVGIDVPNATIIVIEAADRFGLAQLHQLRGRVGRGDKQSYCYLFSESQGQQTKDKLSFFASTQDGMKLAEYDLKLRGSGNIFGTSQHGFFKLMIADLMDYELLQTVQSAVKQFLTSHQLSDYPQLESEVAKKSPTQVSRD